MKHFRPLIVAATLCSLPASVTFGRAVADPAPGRETPSTAMASPAYCTAAHNVGNIALSVTNLGTFGSQFSFTQQDCFTGEPVPSCEYPKGSNTRYLFGGAFWIGAIVGTDTLVSVGEDGWQYCAELHPDEAPFGEMVYRSTVDPTSSAYYGAVSEQDYIAVYADTFTFGVTGLCYDFMDGRPHIPLNVEVTQRSYAWSYPVAEDFVLFDYEIRNIGTEPLSKLYLGIYVDGDVHSEAFSGGVGAQDDISGFLRRVPAEYLPEQCSDSDVVNLAWIADNEGDLLQPSSLHVPHVTGVSIVRAPTESPNVSFNWWISNMDPWIDFGPQARATYRDFGTGGMGTPEGDRNKYHVLSNGEIDYDQIYTASISDDDPIWLPPNPYIKDYLSTGFDTRYLLSFGPFDIDPGQSLPLSFAYVAGENLHTVMGNDYNLPAAPDAYYENLDFSDLARNAIWADWIYDNPGYDSDDDGYAGRVDTCVVGDDTIFTPRKGDGVPDFRAASPPPPPVVRVEPIFEGLIIHWNGHLSETAFDALSHNKDFEGYNAYLATNQSASSFSKLATYDIEDYLTYVWDDVMGWELFGPPRTLDELRCHYAPAGCDDGLWYPLDYPRTRPHLHDGTIMYFEPFGANAAKFGLETPFIKRFADALEPPYKRSEDVPPDSASKYLTGDGYFKYYEYEYTITGLLGGVPYWIAVTAYDCGSMAVGGSPLETAPTVNAVKGIPLAGAGCCNGITGNVDWDEHEFVDLGDLTFLIDYLFISHTPPVCIEEANLDGDPDGVVDIADLTVLIDYLYLTQTPPADCP
ncbi:MAG TPA: hypothetical protein VMY05_07975 [Acidobacteriota bacterium]|nr:hypothetical protein [Acidobacteriota bacterium]